VAYGDSRKLLKEIEDLKAKIDKDVKELGYCEANEKLRADLALKAGQIQCLRMQNEEVQGKNDGMRKRNEELQVKNDGLAKHNKKLQAKNDDLVKENEEAECGAAGRECQPNKEE
jgi:FtsZ-binding cell division protein ZapB